MATRLVELPEPDRECVPESEERNRRTIPYSDREGE